MNVTAESREFRAEVLLRQARAALAEGRLSEARKLLDEIGTRPYDLFQAGPELASAESYRIPEAFRQLFQDRIDWANYCIQYAGEAFEDKGEAP